MKKKVLKEGFAVISQFLTSHEIRIYKNIINDISLNKAGKRNLFRHLPTIRDLARSVAVRNLIEPFIGKGAVAVRALYFDKTPEKNWGVGWHQDITVAVKNKCAVEGFSNWTTKAGIQHVQAHRKIMENMLTVRIHLDDSAPESGGLTVCPKSQDIGVLNNAGIQNAVDNYVKKTLFLKEGDALLMRPLLIHSSNKSMAEH